MNFINIWCENGTKYGAYFYFMVTLDSVQYVYYSIFKVTTYRANYKKNTWEISVILDT